MKSSLVCLLESLLGVQGQGQEGGEDKQQNQERLASLHWWHSAGGGCWGPFVPERQRQLIPGGSVVNLTKPICFTSAYIGLYYSLHLQYICWREIICTDCGLALFVLAAYCWDIQELLVL